MPSKDIGHILFAQKAPESFQGLGLHYWHRGNFQAQPGSLLHVTVSTSLSTGLWRQRYNEIFLFVQEQGKGHRGSRQYQGSRQSQNTCLFFTGIEIGEMARVYANVFSIPLPFPVSICRTPTPTIFAMNPTENTLACSFHCMTVWLAPCHMFRMYRKWNSICTLPVALDGSRENAGSLTPGGGLQG